MKRRPRIHYSASQRALIWERWQKGETLHQIARSFDRYHSSIRSIVAETGGIRPAEHHRRSAARFAAMADGKAIAPTAPTRRRRIEPVARRSVNWCGPER